MVESKGVPMVGPVTGATSLRSGDQRNVFFLRPSYRDESLRLVKQVVEMGLKRIAVVYLDNPFGKEVLKDMSKALEDAKVERSGEFALAVDGKNAAELADKVAADRPGAVLLATTGTANTSLQNCPSWRLPPAVWHWFRSSQTPSRKNRSWCASSSRP
jgi:ABC-type branched-subunit amino acid transport system substrate-binding protein